MTATAGTVRSPPQPSPPSSSAKDDHSEGMSYLESLPRKTVTVYMPLFIILVVLLFPFYWMFITSIKPDQDLSTCTAATRSGSASRPSSTSTSCCSRAPIRRWLMTTMMVATVCATFLSIFASVLAAYAITRIRYRGAQTVGGLIFLAYLVPPSILFIPLSTIIHVYGLFDTPFALILTYPTILIPFCTWLLMGYFKTIPYELEECALIDGASRWQILVKIIIPLAIPGLISAFIFAFTLCWNEFIYALTFISSNPTRRCRPPSSRNFVDGDVFRWGSLMAGALVGSLPLVILYAFFVEHYVSAMTGAVKE
jgi:multiple sugar transport system permease protein